MPVAYTDVFYVKYVRNSHLLGLGGRGSAAAGGGPGCRCRRRRLRVRGGRARDAVAPVRVVALVLVSYGWDNPDITISKFTI